MTPRLQSAKGEGQPSLQQSGHRETHEASTLGPKRSQRSDDSSPSHRPCRYNPKQSHVETKVGLKYSRSVRVLRSPFEERKIFFKRRVATSAKAVSRRKCFSARFHCEGNEELVDDERNRGERTAAAIAKLIPAPMNRPIEVQKANASVARARALEAAGLRVAAVAGHSVGAFAAAVSARVLEFSDALRRVDLRGRSMAAAFGSGYAMGAVTGLDERDVSAIVRQARDVFIAAENAPDQITIARTLAGVERTLEDARMRGARTARRLDVSVPSHTSFMLPIRDLLRDAVRNVTLHRPIVPYAANCDGRAKFEGGDVAADLVKGVRSRCAGSVDPDAVRARRSRLRGGAAGRRRSLRLPRRLSPTQRRFRFRTPVSPARPRAQRTSRLGEPCGIYGRSNARHSTSSSIDQSRTGLYSPQMMQRLPASASKGCSRKCFPKARLPNADRS
jgi:Acyl transferase domain